MSRTQSQSRPQYVVNPFTGRSIRVGGATYNRVAAAVAPRAAAADTPLAPDQARTGGYKRHHKGHHKLHDWKMAFDPKYRSKFQKRAKSKKSSKSGKSTPKKKSTSALTWRQHLFRSIFH